MLRDARTLSNCSVVNLRFCLQFSHYGRLQCARSAQQSSFKSEYERSFFPQWMLLT